MRKLDEAQKEQIRNLIADRVFIDVDVITDETKIGEDLGADSLDNVEILIDVEKHFNINIPDSDFEEVETVLDLYKLVDLYI